MTEDDKEIYQKGVAYLEQWEDVNYCEHSFKFKDEWLTDEEVVDLLNELHEEIEYLEPLANENTHYIADMEDDIITFKQKIEKLEKENEQLKQALKNSYINEICENCKYGHYWISETFGFGKEGEFECTKKHFGNEHWKCDGLTECDDFELKIEM